MPKATLTFQLPEENTEFQLANRGADAFIVLEDLRAAFRSRSKYSSDEAHITDWTEAYKLLCSIISEADLPCL
jgi:hypothetical protein